LVKVKNLRKFNSKLPYTKEAAKNSGATFGVEMMMMMIMIIMTTTTTKMIINVEL
jgi:hypothetical protein